MLLTGQQITLSHSFRVYGLPFRLCTALPEADRLMRGLYRQFAALDGKEPAVEAAVDADGAGRFAWRLAGQGGTVSTLSGALWNLEAALCETIIRFQTRSVALHAATLQANDSLLLLAGSSQSGKTTLSLALAHRGFHLAGDDVALLDAETVTVLPILRCFHLDDRGAALLEADGLALPDA